MPGTNAKKRTLLLTGASRGIGHATVKRFSSAGWRVITCSRHGFPENCPWEMGPEDHIQVDLADPKMTKQAIKEIKSRIGGELHALVNNAGISPKGEGGSRMGTIETSLADWQRILDLNLTSTFLCTRLLGGEMVRRGGCVALAGLSDELAQRLQQAEAYGAFEHYPDAAAARRSLQAVVAKEPAWVLGAWRYFPQRTITLALGESLPAAAEKQLKGYVDDLLAEPWVQYAVFDASRTRTLAPAAELQLTRVAEAMKQRRGLVIVAGATPGLRRAMDTKGLYHWAETEPGAREFIEEEFISRSG